MCTEAIHCVDTATVRFAIYPDGFDGPRILAEITEDALRDFFGAEGNRDSLLQAYTANATAIDTSALERYRLAFYRPVVLTAADFLAPAFIHQNAGTASQALQSCGRSAQLAASLRGRPIGASS